MSVERAEKEQGVVASHNPLVLTLTIVLIVGLAAGAFILSFQALQQLATASAINSNLAWIFPLIVDGFIVTATIAAFSLRGRGRSIIWYPWSALILFSIFSIFGNAVHAINNQDQITVPMWIAAAVSAVPAIALLISSHFLVIMISAPRHVKVAVNEGETILDEPFEEPRIQHVRPLVPPTPIQKPQEPIRDFTAVSSPSTTETTKSLPERNIAPSEPFDSFREVEALNNFYTNAEPVVPKPAFSDTELEAWVRYRLENGETVSNADLQDKLGCSLRTAQRKKAKLREIFPELDNS